MSATDKYIDPTGGLPAVGPTNVLSIKYNLEIVILTMK